MDSSYKQQFSDVVGNRSSPSPQASQVRQSWQGKPVEEQVTACREILYGGIAPILHESNLPEEEVQTAIALFETTFGTAEKLASERSSRSRSTS